MGWVLDCICVREDGAEGIIFKDGIEWLLKDKDRRCRKIIASHKKLLLKEIFP